MDRPPVRILRLGNSTDLDERVPEKERSSWLSAQVFSAATGRSPDLTVRAIWPSPGLPPTLDSWIEKHEPQLVFFAVNAYWFTYRSVPERLKRLLGPLGGPAFVAGARVGRSRFVETRLFHILRRLAGRLIGGDAPFTPEQVLDVVETCLRKIVANEDVVLVVRGPLAAHSHDMGPRIARENAAAWWKVERGLRRLCSSLHIEYAGMDGPDDARGSFGSADLVHPDAKGHRARADMEGRLMARGWLRVHGDESPAAAPPLPPRSSG